MSLEVRTDSGPHGSLILRPFGPLNQRTLPIFERAMHDAAKGQPRALLIDLGKVDGLSSAGIGVLLQFYAQLPESGTKLVVFGARPMDRSVLRLTGLADLVPVVETEEEALAKVL